AERIAFRGAAAPGAAAVPAVRGVRAADEESGGGAMGGDADFVPVGAAVDEPRMIKLRHAALGTGGSHVGEIDETERVHAVQIMKVVLRGRARGVGLG